MKVSKIAFLAVFLTSSFANATTLAELGSGKSGTWWYRCLIAVSDDEATLYVDQVDLVYGPAKTQAGESIQGVARTNSTRYALDEEGAVVATPSYKLRAISKIDSSKSAPLDLLYLATLLPNGHLGLPLNGILLDREVPANAVTIRTTPKGALFSSEKQATVCVTFPLEMRVSADQSQKFTEEQKKSLDGILRGLSAAFGKKVCGKGKVRGVVDALKLTASYCSEN